MLGLAGYSITEILHLLPHLLLVFSRITIPSYGAMANDEILMFLKYAFTYTLFLTFLDYTLSFTIYTDALGFGIGAVLMQQTEGQRPHVVYATRALTAAERKYSVNHSEAYAVI